MAVPVLETFAQTTGTWTSNPQAMTAPTGILEDDGLLILLFQRRDNESSSGLYSATGWTLEIDGDHQFIDVLIGCLSKVASGTESSDGSVDVSITSPGSNAYTGWYCRISGIDAAGFIDTVSASVNHSTSQDTATTVPGISTTASETLVFTVAGCREADTDPFTYGGSWTKQDEYDAGVRSGSFGTLDHGSSGATGDLTISHNLDNPSRNSSFMIAVAAGAGGGVTVPIFHHHYNQMAA